MTSKPGSRWNFLQQAVASVESRLDDILTDEGERPKKTAPAPAPTKKSSADLSRSSSNGSTTNDRLQERLARAMAKKNAQRTDSPAPAQDQEAVSEKGGDISTRVADSQDNLEPQSDEMTKTTGEQLSLGGSKLDVDGMTEPDTTPDVKAEKGSDSLQLSMDVLRTSNRPSEDLSRTSEDSQVRRATGEAVELQEEMNVYLERIDALRRDMQILVQTVSNAAKKSADTAREAAAAAEPGSLDQKLSQKDEKIALLIEEGTRLSKTEIDLRSTVKKIRTQAVAGNRDQEAAKARAEKAERALKAMEERASRAEAASRRAEQNLAVNATAAKDLGAVRKERDTLSATLAEAKAQLSTVQSRAGEAESKAQSEQLEKEKKRSAELQDELTSAKTERDLAEEKLQRQIHDLQAGLQREKEQARAMESEMLGEQAALESKLESFRVRAEEASSADTGHTQAKLLRQVETLQTQYASASQNWQGIESSLLGQITALEKERDEVVSRETELRKKLRDVTLKLKQADRELDTTRTNYIDMDKSLADANVETQRVQRKADQLEADLATALKTLETQKQSAERDLQRRIDEEKSKWTANLSIPRTESPAASLRKNSGIGFDINHLISPAQYERASSRRSPIMPNAFDSNTPPRQQSSTSIRGMANGSTIETPSVVTSVDQDEYFANVSPTPLTTSHHSARGHLQDLISTSTVGAGPSVQLVERMSANVRRLESEKAASKDELARLATQRDEARQEVVNLMREVEAKRKIEDRLKVLEEDNAGLTRRHQTTLELLGEKSEQVEELKADVLDVKQMYRQLADTMK